MLSESQQAYLEAVVQSVEAGLFIESATLDAQQTLELVLCREYVCFRPLQISARDVNVSAALEGDAGAQQALKAHLQTTLQGLL
ncbi:MAG: hypothetical protein V3S24_17690 [Candidatus Tectomicrobia bacterium]